MLLGHTGEEFAGSVRFVHTQQPHGLDVLAPGAGRHDEGQQCGIIRKIRNQDRVPVTEACPLRDADAA